MKTYFGLKFKKEKFDFENDISTMQDKNYGKNQKIQPRFIPQHSLAVHLPRLKNIYSTYMCITRENTIPFLATSKGAIEYIGKYNSNDEGKQT